MPALPHFGLHEISPFEPDFTPFSHPVLTLTVTVMLTVRMGGLRLGQREAVEYIR